MDPKLVAVLGPVWVALGVTVVVYGVRARRDERALVRGCVAVSVLWILAGALVNAAILAFGGSYSGFADGAYVDYVHDTWESLVVPNQGVFIGMLIAFEALAGVLVLMPGRLREAALVALIAFNVALLSFGWGFYAWSFPVATGLALLLKAERRRAGTQSQASGPPAVAGRHALSG
jgi:hypothetical protein